MKILVTGAAGFIGSHFSRYILNQQAPIELHKIEKITLLDSLDYSGNLANLSDLLPNPMIEFIKGDITDSELMNELCFQHNYIVNFAAKSHVDRSILNSTNFVATNVLGTQVLLESALRNKITTFLQVSTDEIYGSINSGSWTEKSPMLPNSPYAASKAAAELMVRSFVRTHDLDVRVTRCSNNYGTNQYPEKAIPLFITNILRGKKIPIYGSGENTREWIHVDDHCRALWRVLTSNKRQTIYNIGSGIELSNLELASKICSMMGYSSELIEHVEDRKGHDFRYSLDSSKIELNLGFKPEIEFQIGLKDTIDWYVNNEKWWQPLL